ncbi:bark storage protein a-like, partial [Trifolium pratense]
SNINKEGSYLGIVVPNPYELSPLFQSSTFVPHNKFPYFDFAGVATQLLLTLFDVRGVLHYGIAGNLNSRHQIGDVAIPKYWAHTGEWHWQRFGDKEDGNGKFNTEFGYLKFSDYKNYTKHSESSVENLLNKVWYQPERIFPVNGTPEKWQDVFWVPVDKTYFEIARKLKVS